MEYIHVRSLEQHHPGYKDRTMQWGKIFISMVQGDPEFELIDSEVDKWRFVSMILLELQARKPLPNTERYWRSKGFDLKKRPISLTLQMLHNFLDTVTEDEPKPLPRVEKSRVEKSREDILSGKPDLTEPIRYLNLKTRKSFSINTKPILNLIAARFNEGRSIEDFKRVIDCKCGKWLKDPKMMDYLRPSTLFNATNFENYLNEKEEHDNIPPSLRKFIKR